MKPAIAISNIGKRYKISHQHKAAYRSLRDEIVEGITAPLSLLSGTQDEVEQFWALKGISFDVPQGQIIGIIGRNGSGKSTLLKILSRIVDPTEGQAVMRGKVASLLEVGTGFHPELTGRENIYFNGSILGMTKREITRKFDDIVAFAETEQFLDTPVKFYSSGMYVRLAFAVAAHLDPDILIVDEVLAVGDAEFQKKCLGKISTSAREGRTILFVSHSMEAVSSLCNQAILLEKGRIKAHGEVAEVIKEYIGSSDGSGEFEEFRGERMGDQRVKIAKIVLTGADSQATTSFSYGGPLNLEVNLESELKQIPKVRVDLNIFNDKNQYLACYSNFSKQPDIKGKTLKLEIPALLLAPGSYTANISLHRNANTLEDLIAHAVQFDVLPTPAVIPGLNNIVYADLVVHE
jgi:homopolymeric O-antigen transport system ATP-binding protein